MEVNYDIEYIDDIHTYLINGIIAPSVTQIISKIFPDTYSNIPRHILDKACEFGTSVHEMIEKYEKGEHFQTSPLLDEILDGYCDICGDNEIEVINMEQFIHYEDLYAGRYDILAKVKGLTSIIDIKTTSKVHDDMLEWQLGMYKSAIERHTDTKIEKGYCLWLPKRNAPRLLEIKPKSELEIKEMLNEINNAR